MWEVLVMIIARKVRKGFGQRFANALSEPCKKLCDTLWEMLLYPINLCISANSPISMLAVWFAPGLRAEGLHRQRRGTIRFPTYQQYTENSYLRGL